MLTPMREGALPTRARGFSLIEIAVGLLVIAILLGAMLVPLTTQVAQRKISDTQKTLDDIKESLLGFAIARGRLPCPASFASNSGMESFCTDAAPQPCGAEILVPAAPNPGHGRCSSPDGFVPGAALGLAPTDARGYAIDAWGARIRYAVSTNASNPANINAFTATNGMRNATMALLMPDLHVCATSTGITATTCGATNTNLLTSSAPAVIYSLGPNWATGGTSADEAANLNGDQVFVSRVRTALGAASGEFDDIVTWLSENVLYNRMVNAGQLP